MKNLLSINLIFFLIILSGCFTEPEMDADKDIVCCSVETVKISTRVVGHFYKESEIYLYRFRERGNCGGTSEDESVGFVLRSVVPNLYAVGEVHTDVRKKVAEKYSHPVEVPAEAPETDINQTNNTNTNTINVIIPKSISEGGSTIANNFLEAFGERGYDAVLEYWYRIANPAPEGPDEEITLKN